MWAIRVPCAVTLLCGVYIMFSGYPMAGLIISVIGVLIFAGACFVPGDNPDYLWGPVEYMTRSAREQEQLDAEAAEARMWSDIFDADFDQRECQIQEAARVIREAQYRARMQDMASKRELERNLAQLSVEDFQKALGRPNGMSEPLLCDCARLIRAATEPGTLDLGYARMISREHALHKTGGTVLAPNREGRG